VKSRSVVWGGAWICLALTLPARGDEESLRLAALLRDAAPSIVTVKVLAKTTIEAGGRSADHDIRSEVPGVVVDASGLVMTSIVPFAPERLLAMLAPSGRAGMPKTKTVPSEIKVLVEQEEKEHDAFLAATDTKLGVAFLQLEDLAGRKLKAVDFSPSARAAVGDLVAAVSRLGKGYDSPPYLETARISGEISKPRQAWVIDGGLSSLGLPVFAPGGRVIGVLALVDSGLAETESGEELGLAALMRMFGGSGQMRFFIVPAPAVAALIDQARQQAAEKAAERAATKAAPPPPG
jgi:hypothetical protein